MRTRLSLAWHVTSIDSLAEAEADEEPDAPCEVSIGFATTTSWGIIFCKLVCQLCTLQVQE